MKIVDIEQSQTVQSVPDSSRKKGQGETGPFGRILEAEMHQESSENVKSQQPAEVAQSMLYGADPLAASQGYGWNQGAYEAVAAGIEILEEVEQALRSGDVNAKALNVLVDSLGEQVEGMKECLKELPAGHPLGLIAEELSVLSYVESLKWKRGDYL